MHKISRSHRYMIRCQGNRLDFVSLAICLLRSDYMLCDNMISSVENGDDHSTFNSGIFFSSARPRQDQTTSRSLPFHTENAKCMFFKQLVTGTMGLPHSSRDQASFTALPFILPFPLPIPAVPYHPPPLPFSHHTPPFSHTPFYTEPL